ncbi:MAG: Replicative DNA helicase [Candidatus Izimaplasma bacterium HR2]|nr:MAG: Replicative DNA helicase [Candidatus Izimaplasma bacterium HR2]
MSDIILSPNSQYLEQVMTKALLEDKDYVVNVTRVFEEHYFDSAELQQIFSYVSSYFKTHREIPTKETVINSVPIDSKESVQTYLDEIDNMDIDVIRHRDWLMDQTDIFLKDKAIKDAIRNSVDIIDSGENTYNIRKLIEDALCRTMDVDLGLDYFGDLGPRLHKMFTDDTQRIPTYFPVFDEFINGGFPPKTLSVLTARIHGFKCLSYNSYIHVKINEIVEKVKIGDFYNKYTYKKELIEEKQIPMVNVAKESVDIKDKTILVLSDNGWIPVDFVHKTHSFRKYVVLFESGRELECADNHCLITDGYKEVLVRNLSIDDVILSDDGVDVVFDIFDTGEYEEMYDITMQDHHLFYTNGILSHNSNVMANMIARQVLNGHNVALASLEMSEEMFAQRFDGIYSKLDINKFYFNQRLQSQLVERLRNVKSTEGRGQLFIKSFPTGKASVADFKIWMRELKLRGFDIDIFFFDYLNLMTSEEIKKGDNSYLQVKSIAEETRAMGFEFNIPMVSVSQLNRSGTFMSFDEVDFNSIADSLGIPATADFMIIMGSNDEHMVYSQEVHYKLVKNRLGGRVGEMDKFYYDARSMKMYCSSELDLWMDDVVSSGDERNIASQQGD